MRQPARQGLVAQRANHRSPPERTTAATVRVAGDDMGELALDQFERNRARTASELPRQGAGGHLHEHVRADEALHQRQVGLHVRIALGMGQYDGEAGQPKLEQRATA